MVYVTAADTPTMLDLTAGAITIGASGASGGGLASAETELNSAGYVIDGKSSPVKNKITIEKNTNVTITLRSLFINGSNILIDEGAVVTLIIENNNTIIAAANSAAITVNATAKLIIRGGGALTAHGGTRAAGIGAKYMNECGDITIYSGTILANGGTQGGAGIGGSAGADIVGNITIYGGNIKAQGADGTTAAGIGGGANRYRSSIAIYGGTISATGGDTSAWGIGDGVEGEGIADPVVIDAGSVSGSVQGRPQNADGTDVYRVEAILEGAADQTVTMLDEWGKAWEASGDSKGALFAYLPQTAQIAAAQHGGKLYTAAIEIKEDDSEQVVLQEYTGEPCSCTASSASFTLADRPITVNENMGFESVALSAQFEHAEDCEYPIHGGTVVYTLNGNVTDTEAIVEDNIMTVYTGADGQTLSVTATVEIGGKTYTTSANYPVTVSDAAMFDLSAGSIVINQDNVQVGSRTYTVQAGKPIYIYQQRPERSVSNTIRVAEGVTKDVVFSGINIQRMGVTDYAVDILGNVNLTLEGQNSIVENGDDHPAIRCGIGKNLTIDGTGSLTVKGGRNAAGIGGINQGTAGTITINGGVVDVTAGAGGGAAIGSGANGSGVTVIVNGGKVFARSSDGVGIGNGRYGYGATVKITGGMVQADGGAKGIAGTTVRIDGGSVNANDFAEEQLNSQNQRVYRTTLTVEDAGTAVGMRDVTYKLGESMAEVATSTDQSGKLYLYLPAGEDWVKICVNDGEKNYYKRMQISSTQINQGICTSEPKREIISFSIPGQLSSEIDTEAHTISVKMSMGAYLESLIPVVHINGSQYLPVTAQDFSHSAETPVVYTVIGDDGLEQTYQVTVTKEEGSLDEPIQLDISEGIIQISASEVQVGENTMRPPHPGGYIITGASDKNMIVIATDEEEGKITFPIIFKDLTISAPQMMVEGETEYFSPVFVDGEATITLQGISTLTGGTGVNAMHVPEASVLTLQGDGVLNLYGGAQASALGGSANEGEASGAITINNGCITAVGGVNAPAVGGAAAATEQGRFIINGGSVHLIDGENVTGGKSTPISSTGAPIYPMEILIADGSITNAVVGYNDSAAAETASLRTDAEGKLYVYRVNGTYDISISYDGKKYYGSAEVKNAACSVVVDLPKVTSVQFTDPQTYRAADVVFVLQGSHLGGELMVIATAADGSTVSGSAVKNRNGYSATLSFPENQSFTEDMQYTITVTADGQTQTLAGTPVIVKPKKLRITAFTVPNQIGDAAIDESNNTITVQVPYDVTDKTFIPNVVHNGAGIIPTTALDFANPATYTVLASTSSTGSQDSRKYTVNVVNQAAPRVTALQFENSLTAAGGTVEITVIGTNLENLDFAVNHTKEITVSADGLTPAIVTKNAQGVWTARLNVPANTSITQAKEYLLQVRVGGELQTITGRRTVTVPRALDSNGEISAFEIDGQFGESVITSIDGSTYTIVAYMPYGSDLTSILPYVELSSSAAEYSPRTAQNFTSPVVYTVTAANGQIKTYTVTVTEFKDMTCGQIVISNPETSAGGEAVVNLNAAFTTSVRAVAVSADGEEIEGEVMELHPSLDVEEGTVRISFLLPENTNVQSDAVYTLKIWLDGVEQTVSSQHRLVVPHKTSGGDVSDLQITSISVPKMSGQPRFDGNTITIRTRRSVKEIEPEIEHTGVRITPTGVQDFSEPVVYTIYDADGRAKYYTVIVKRISSSSTIANWNLLPDIGSATKPADDPTMIVVENKPYMTGYEDETFRPQNSVTRAETAQILAMISEDYDAETQYSQSFTDVLNPTWYSNAVGFVSRKGIAQGDEDGAFRPEDSVTRMEFAAMIARFANVQPETGKTFFDTVGAWGEGYIAALSNAGILTGYEDGSFRPNQQVTRAEAVAVINRVIGREPNKAAIDSLTFAFSDVAKTHWAYYEIMAASAQYEYEVPEENE